MATSISSETVFDFSRAPVTARRGMAASSQKLASEAGRFILQNGGNAADAAVAMAAALNVTEPGSTGLGGDCFALYYEAATRTVTALNGSGRAPAALTIELLCNQGLAEGNAICDPFHAHNVTVPGACAGWCDLIGRHGTMSLGEILAPAIQLAEEGFPVGPVTASFWQLEAEHKLRMAPGGVALTIDGRGPRAGEIFRNPGLARALRVIAGGGKDAFYRGAIGRDLARSVQAAGGVLDEQDLAAHESTWEEPLSVAYRGHRVWECPPNGQGLAALLALRILEGFELPATEPWSIQRWHRLIEALRLAFADASWHVADPRFSDIPVAALLSEAYVAGRRRMIDPSQALVNPQHGVPAAGSDTVYFCVVDGQGNACSFINSNYRGFGTGIVPTGARGPWGFALQNRGNNFSLDPNHPNALAPRKRPYHTIIPGLITRADGSLYGPFGVMGGFMQPQGHVQVVVALLDDGLDPQAAVNRPRLCLHPVTGASQVSLETGFPAAVAEGLKRLGHAVRAEVTGDERALFGRGQVIRQHPDGTLTGGSDPRADGCAVGW